MPQWLTNLLARNTPSCKEVIQLISNSMEQPLPLRQRIMIRLHLLICKWCVRYQKQIRFIRNILVRNREKVGENTPDSLSPEVKDRIKQALRKQPPSSN